MQKDQGLSRCGKKQTPVIIRKYQLIRVRRGTKQYRLVFCWEGSTGRPREITIRLFRGAERKTKWGVARANRSTKRLSPPYIVVHRSVDTRATSHGREHLRQTHRKYSRPRQQFFSAGVTPCAKTLESRGFERQATLLRIIQHQALWAQVKVRGFLLVREHHTRTHGS